MEMGRPSLSVSGSTHELETLPEGKGEQAKHSLLSLSLFPDCGVV